MPSRRKLSSRGCKRGYVRASSKRRCSKVRVSSRTGRTYIVVRRRKSSSRGKAGSRYRVSVPKRYRRRRSSSKKSSKSSRKSRSSRRLKLRKGMKLCRKSKSGKNKCHRVRRSSSGKFYVNRRSKSGKTRRQYL